MRVTQETRSALAIRRQKRELQAKGFEFLDEIDWRIERGGLYRKRVAEVVLGADGNSLFYRLKDRRDEDA